MPKQLTNAEAECVAVLERLGFAVTQELSGGDEEWLALRADLHLRAESASQLLSLYNVRDRGGQPEAPDET